MFSKRSPKENAELTERFSISENVRLIQDLPGVHRLVKLTVNEGFLAVDFPKSSTFFSTRLHADDTSLTASGSNLDSLLREINSPLPAVYEWLCSNKLKGFYQACLITFSNMLVIGIHTIQGMHRSKTSVNRVLVLTLENKCFPIKQ